MMDVDENIVDEANDVEMDTAKVAGDAPENAQNIAATDEIVQMTL